MDLLQVISIFIIIGLVFAAAFLMWSIIIWTVVIGVVLFLFTILGFLPLTFVIISWLIFIAAAVFANMPAWRQKYLLAPSISRLKGQMPSISDTERTAIEAGDTWWEKQLFCGRPDWRQLYSMPKPTLSSEEQSFIDNQVEVLCSKINDWESVQNLHDLSEEVWAYLKSEKFFGMVIPKNYGGLGFSALAHSTVVTKIASRSISAAVTAMVPNSLGPGELICRYGTEAQKNYYLPKLASGEEMPCFALTAPTAGSDAGAIPDTGIITKGTFEGKKTIGIKLNWDKRYITLAPVATVVGVAFKLYDPDHLLGEVEDLGITLALIPSSLKGVEVGERHFPMLLSFMNGPTKGTDVFIPLDFIIGGEKMIGQGWRMMMESLSIGRSISLPALSTGSSKIAYRITGAYSRVRRQFNTPLSMFEGVQEALGVIAGYTYMLDACRMMTAGAIDQNINPSIVSAIAKYNMTEMNRKVINHALDIHSGHMVQTGPKNFLVNIYNAIPISITVEGANILTRNLIIFGQGAIRCHPYLLEEVALISASEVDVKALDKTLMSHIGFFVSNLLCTLGYGLTGGFFIRSDVKDKKLRPLLRQVTRMSRALALVADASLITLGGSLKRRELISARLGDVLSQLYLASTVLKYYHDEGEQPADVDYVAWCLEECLYRAQIAFNGLFANYPIRALGGLLRFLVFPFGQTYRGPSDRLHSKVIETMTEPSELRDRITRYAYINKENDSLNQQLESALLMLPTVEPILKKYQKAMQSGLIAKSLSFDERMNQAKIANLLTEDEVKQLKNYEKLKDEIISVNVFSHDLKEVIS